MNAAHTGQGLTPTQRPTGKPDRHHARSPSLPTPMRRLFILALLLWLPLQAWAAVAAMGNPADLWAASNGPTAAAVAQAPCEHMLQVPAPPPSASAAGSGAHAQPCGIARAEHDAADCHGGLPCCTALGVALAATAAARAAPAFSAAAPWPGRAAHFSSALADRALKPPITVA